MKWKSNKVNIGQERIEKKFLLFPKCINNEWRWLEKVSYKQRYRRELDSSGFYCYLWEDVEWL